MRAGRRILAVVPARGGSKGVALKNLRPVAGVPLVVRAGWLARELAWLDRAVCSTDHGGISVAARDAGLDVVWRPAALSGDRVGDLEVLTHALETAEAEDGVRYDVVAMLQPTSPLRRPEHVEACVDRLAAGDLDAVWTVSRTDPKAHPLKQLVLEGDRIRLWDERGAGVVARQQLEPVYHRNGAAYAITRACLLEQGSILGKNASAVVIDEPMLSIDDEADFARVEAVLRERGEAVEAPAAPAASTGTEPAAGPLTFVCDVDGVIASIVPGNDYRRSEPLVENIALVNELHDAGHRVVLFTARGSASGRDWAEHTRAQLAAWGVRHHELRLGKPSADFYIDDRLVSLADAARIARTGRIARIGRTAPAPRTSRAGAASEGREAPPEGPDEPDPHAGSP